MRIGPEAGAFAVPASQRVFTQKTTDAPSGIAGEAMQLIKEKIMQKFEPGRWIGDRRWLADGSVWSWTGVRWVFVERIQR